MTSTCGSGTVIITLENYKSLWLLPQWNWGLWVSHCCLLYLTESLTVNEEVTTGNVFMISILPFSFLATMEVTLHMCPLYGMEIWSHAGNKCCCMWAMKCCRQGNLNTFTLYLNSYIYCTFCFFSCDLPSATVHLLMPTLMLPFLIVFLFSYLHFFLRPSTASHLTLLSASSIYHVSRESQWLGLSCFYGYAPKGENSFVSFLDSNY